MKTSHRSRDLNYQVAQHLKKFHAAKYLDKKCVYSITLFRDHFHTFHVKRFRMSPRCHIEM